MKRFAFLMILVFLFIGMVGFGSINEFETVDTVDALMIDAVSVDEILLDSVAVQETMGLELLDVRAMIAVTGFNDYLRILLSSYYVGDMNALSIHVTFGLKVYSGQPGTWGDRNRYILSSPYGGSKPIII